MPENEKEPAQPTTNEDALDTGKTCLQIKELKDKERALMLAENARMQGLSEFFFSRHEDKRLYESKSTNTEDVNKAIYFSYPSRRHSCTLVNIPKPCVNKMISHIEDVESKIQEHLTQFEASFEEWTSVTKDKEAGLDVSAPEKQVHPEKGKDEKCPELKKRMETLLSEAIHLIKSLETDRAEAEQALKQHKSRKKKISMKIDSWSIWKLQELPLAVQKEHENFSKINAELRSYLEDIALKVEQLQERKEKLEKANAKLQVDIDYMASHSVLLEKKRKQELGCLKERYHKKFEVMEKFRAIHEELKESVDKCEGAKARLKNMKVENEREIQEELINATSYEKELDKLSVLDAHYTTSIETVNLDIEGDEEAMNEVLRETQSTTNELENLKKTVDDLKRLFDQYCWRQRKYENEYLEAFSNFYSLKKTWDIELSNVSKDAKDLTIVYEAQSEENKRIQSEIQSITDDIEESIKKTAEMEEEVHTFVEMKMKNNNYLKQLYKQAYQVGAVYHLSRHKTEELEDKLADLKRIFKGREELLKKLTRGDIATGIEIQKRLYAIEETQFIEMQEFIRRQVLYNMALLEVEEQLKELEAEAVRIRYLHRQHSKMLHNIRKRKERVKKNVDATKKKLLKKSKKSRMELTRTEGKRSIIHEEIEIARGQTVALHEKCIELSKEIRIMNLERTNYEERLKKLQEEFFKLQFDREHVHGVYDHLMREKQYCEERIFEEERRFRRLIDMRKNTLKNIRKCQDDLLEENLRLAKEYQSAQLIFLKEKESYFNGYDRLLSLNFSLSDKKKLCQLQKRLDQKWQEYFRLMILFNKTKLAKFQGDSQNSIQKILAVQEESSSLMQHILDFFKSFPNSSCGEDD
ncbi:coiled-coil domain-containing protein 178 [Mus musculus]|uniref:Coiled-coil domain-containing protein 178 n=2 Tax=Mus musculus TaxID=10090 RepID=CC178_MOUSE|nr:coiled-coil domain-containing protein 178 [Mus musculus]Q8CDV0.2 RecName: Full=Coiled-coil domain-containing protein 178 [Mus musculus]AAI40994.1 4921528I01Rik protein [Mus musculus]AAI45067.1 4921528I01Rik protein [Mus musculus]|eukprot:NP_081892.2 coiled-coil domain-containing protein 178 [Mus musculus]